jgi:hypothetical protein
MCGVGGESATRRPVRESILIFAKLYLLIERHTVEWQALVWQANTQNVLLALSLLVGSNLGER